MNIDDPKLTAFALDELDEPERSTIAREVSDSPEAQRVVDETREIARALKNEFAAELNEKAKPSRSLSDIRDDPWFWGIGRPLAIAAMLAIFGVIAGVIFWPRQQPSQFAGSVNLPPAGSSDIQAEVTPELHEELALAVPAATALAQTSSAPVDAHSRNDLTTQPAAASAPVVAKRGKPAKSVPASRFSGGI